MRETFQNVQDFEYRRTEAIEHTLGSHRVDTSPTYGMSTKPAHFRRAQNRARIHFLRKSQEKIQSFEEKERENEIREALEDEMELRIKHRTASKSSEKEIS